MLIGNQDRHQPECYVFIYHLLKHENKKSEKEIQKWKGVTYTSEICKIYLENIDFI